MAAEYDTEQALVTFRCGGVDPHLFLVSRWSGSEGVSSLYRFEVDLASADDDIDLNAILGTRATLSIRTDVGDVLPWHGIVTELKQTGRDETYAWYRAVLEPQLALLRLFRMSRVYVHADEQFGGKPDLASTIRRVLEQVGLTREGEGGSDPGAQYAIRIPDADLAFTRSRFICQFEETSLDFLRRRLEHAGVYFWFEQGHDHEVVVFGNDREQQPSRPVRMAWRPIGELNPDEGVVAVSRFDHAVSVQPRGVVLRDFSVSKPSLDLTVQADVDQTASASAERFDTLGNVEVYGSHYTKQGDGERIAAIRAEEIACQRHRYYAEARSSGIRAGLLVELAQHFRDDLNDRYYVIEASHEGHQALPRHTNVQVGEGSRYEARFTVLPATTQYRPPRVTRVPRVVGFLSAIVVAEGDGQYAQMNEHGCYRIRFLFAPPGSAQQDQANSAWVRMATPYAGSQHGMNFPLLKGTEVMVSFLGGDPDRPVIVAAIPNEENPSIRNQDTASRPGLRTAGQNALEFEDRQGQEHARLSSPGNQTTIHLGTDTDRPEQSGIRMSTGAHVGMGSRSYIQQIAGIYQEEIGRAGEVDTDPEPRMQLEAAQKDQLARYFEDQAVLPNARPAQQLKALTSRMAANEGLLKLLDARLQKLRQQSTVDADGIQSLLDQIQALQAQQAELADAASATDDDALTKFLNEWYEKRQQQAAKEAQDKKTNYQKAFEDAGQTVAEKTKGFVGVALDHSLVRNSFSMGFNGSFFLGANLMIEASASYRACLALESGYNLLGRKKVETKGGLRVRADKYQLVNLDVEERVLKTSVDRVAEETRNVVRKTDLIQHHLYDAATARYLYGEGGLDCMVHGGDYVVSTTGSSQSKLAFNAGSSHVTLRSDALTIDNAAPDGIALTAGQSSVKIKPASMAMKAAAIDIDARPGRLTLAGSNITVGEQGAAIIKLG